MNNNQTPGPQYVNYGFQEGAGTEGRPPANASAPQIPNVPLSVYPQYTPQTINTHHTFTPGLPHPVPVRKVVKKSRCKCIVALILSVLVLLGAAGALVWYFLSYQCVLGRSCSEGGVCLNASQWCDGIRDCPGGEDESQCLRLHGSGFVLQSYSSDSQMWKPVCADNWNDNIGRATCQQIGYSSGSYVRFSQRNPGSLAVDGYMKLSGFDPHSLLQGQLTSSPYCSLQAVSLQCIDCGVSGREPTRSRIVGGDIAVSGAWPWQVSLHSNYQHQCGGSIISPEWIITAAHCVETLSQPSQWTVYAGYLIQIQMAYATGNSVRRIISHEKYDKQTKDNDIALMKLNTPLTMSDKVRPVCLPNFGVNLTPQREAWISGWGSIRSGGLVSENLRQARITMYSRHTCNAQLVYNGRVTTSMICAGTLAGGVDSCQGDSGGPMVAKEGSLWWLVGDTSWGIGCALKNKPGIYGNVSHFLPWIYEQMQDREPVCPVRGLAIGEPTTVWRNVAHPALLNRHRDLSWMVAHEILPVRAVMHSRGMARTSACPRPGCGQEESVRHMLWECRAARDLWKEAGPLITSCLPAGEDLTPQLVLYGVGRRPIPSKAFTKLWPTLTCLKEALWSSRNLLVAKNVETTPQAAAMVATEALGWYGRKGASTPGEGSPTTP